jgi:formiminotetrahydrofolate cyclodeaminase
MPSSPSSRSIWSESLASFSDAVAATRPAPAGVCAAAVAAELGMCLMIKAMSITGGHGELVEAARREAADLRGAADDDVGAVMEFIGVHDAAAKRKAIEAPLRAARAAVSGLELCVHASSAVKKSLAVDQAAAEALIAGALKAILMCVAANLQGHETDYPDAVSEHREIEDRARRTGVYSP